MFVQQNANHFAGRTSCFSPIELRSPRFFPRTFCATYSENNCFCCVEKTSRSLLKKAKKDQSALLHYLDCNLQKTTTT